MNFENIVVRCYSGYRSNEAPRSIIWRSKEFQIVRIIDRWYEGGINSSSEILDYYKVELDDGSIRIIRYSRLFDGWGILI